MNGSEGRPDWVEKRINCTLHGTFEKIVGEVQHDVRRFNELRTDPSIDPEFKCRRTETEAFVVYADERRDEIRIRGSQHAIDIYRRDDVLFSVEQRWNEETLECDLLIEEKVHTPWQISQKAIGSLLFP